MESKERGTEREKEEYGRGWAGSVVEVWRKRQKRRVAISLSTDIYLEVDE